jgi:hypothetical protein
MHAYECLIPRPAKVSPAGSGGLPVRDVRFEPAGGDAPMLPGDGPTSAPSMLTSPHPRAMLPSLSW